MFRTNGCRGTRIRRETEQFAQPCGAPRPRVSHTADCAGAPPPMPQEHVMATTNGSPQPAPDATQNPPQLNVLAQYIKDLSFENPNAPRSLQGQQQPPQIN